jgi:Protein of unknown function (DUF3313)
MSPAFKILLPTALMIVGCTTVPEPSADFQKYAEELSPAKGIRSKRIATATPSPAIAEGSVLIIRDVMFDPSILRSTRVNSEKRDVVANALSRNMCSDLSKLFEISETSDAENAFSLRMRITELTPNSRVGAAIGKVTGFISPVSARPPIGLGSLSAEFELLRPDGSMAAAMAWSQKADMMSNGSRLSTIGDAYESTEAASKDFAELVQPKSGSGRIGATIVDSTVGSIGFGSKADPGCDKYGKKDSFMSGILSLPPRAAEGPTKP